MQASMFELAKLQGGLEPVKWDQMGYAGEFCSIKFTNLQKKKEIIFVVQSSGP